MNTRKMLFQRITKFGLILMMGMSMSAEAGLFGFGGDSWKEEVLLHDGQKLIVGRSQSYGGSHEIGQTPPIKEQKITFTAPNTSKTITFKSEYGEDIGRANFQLLALHILKDTPYIIAEPNLCLSYNKWGRPNPPYVIFKYQDKEWKRISVQELPAEFKEFNLLIETKGNKAAIAAQSIVTAELVKNLNDDLRQPEYRTILHEPAAMGMVVSCPVLVPIKGGGWESPGGWKSPIPIIPTQPKNY